MKLRFRNLMMGLAAIAGSFSSAAAAEDGAIALAVGKAHPGVALSTGQTALFTTEAVGGDYLKGTLESGSGRFDLDLVTQDGEHLRRLLNNTSGTADFQFVVESDPVLMRLTARSDVTGYTLTLTNKVTPEQQRPPEQVYLSPMMEQTAADIAAGGSTEAFWKKVAEQGTPLVETKEDGTVIATFLWRGATKNVRLFGSPSGDHENLERIGSSDIWFKSFAVPADTRLSYQLAPDVPDVPGTARERRVAILSTAQEDPFNHHPWPADGIDRFDRDSVFELPGAPPQPYLAERGNPKGSLQKLMVKSETLGNEREITIYRPAGFDPGNRENLLLFMFDAAESLTKIPTPTVLDNMIAEGKIPPTVAVFIANPGPDARARELPANPVFADFMAEQLLPLVISETGITHDPSRTVLAGMSYGGLASMTVALRHPELFGNVLSMSGSYWWSPPGTPADRQEYVAGLIAEKPVPPIRVFLSAGLFETGASRGVASIIDTNRHLRNMLLARNTQVIYREYAGGHDYLIWRGTISDGLIALFGK